MSKNTSAYFNKGHATGRIGTIIAICFMIGIPLSVCFRFNVWPSFGAVIANASGLLAIYLPTALSEVISYTPMLGTACYITFITGNVGNLKVPCALNAIQMTDSALGTERGDSVIAVAVAVSSMVTMIVVAIGVLLLVPLQPILLNPSVKTATSFMLPALFGSMSVSNLLTKRSGDYEVHNRPTIILIPLGVVLFINYFIAPIKGKEGFLILACIPLTILSAYIMKKTGIVTVEKIANKAVAKAEEILVADDEDDEGIEAIIPEIVFADDDENNSSESYDDAEEMPEGIRDLINEIKSEKGANIEEEIINDQVEKN